MPALPPALAAYQPLVNKLMAKEPGQRFGSAREALENLQQTDAPDEAAETRTQPEPLPALAG